MTVSVEALTALAEDHGFLIEKTEERRGEILLTLRDKYDPTHTFKTSPYGSGSCLLEAHVMDVKVWSNMHKFSTFGGAENAEEWVQVFAYLRSERVQAAFRGYQATPALFLRAVSESFHDRLPELHAELEAVLARHRVKIRVYAPNDHKLRRESVSENFIYIEEVK